MVCSIYSLYTPPSLCRRHHRCCTIIVLVVSHMIQATYEGEILLVNLRGLYSSKLAPANHSPMAKLVSAPTQSAQKAPPVNQEGTVVACSLTDPFYLYCCCVGLWKKGKILCRTQTGAAESDCCCVLERLRYKAIHGNPSAVKRQGEAERVL